ncbi:MAG TPA: ABC transporter ATP-binding protein [Dongiaceae bacterium]|nr:ABC transporter ATP-binding protein [Dongiaceae bacterium]
MGVASLIPMIVAAGASGKHSALSDTVLRVVHSVGLPADPLYLLIVSMAGLVLKAVLSLLAWYQVGLAIAEVGTNMRMNLIGALLDARWGFFVREPIGRFANALGVEALRASEAYSAVAQLLAHAIQAVVYLLIAAWFSWKFAALAAVVGAIMMLSLKRFVTATGRQSRKQTKQTKRMIVRLADVLIGLKPMKAMGRQARFMALFAKDVHAIDVAMRHQFFAKQANRVLQEPIVFLCIGVGIYAALTTSAMPLAELMMMTLLLMKTVSVIGRVQEDLQAVYIAESGFSSIHRAIEDARNAREETIQGRAPTLNRGIELSHVSMAFGRKHVIENASFTVPAGEITAIVGASGAGKTTLVDLMLGLHQPVAGRILIDGEPLQELDIMKWRSMVGYVPQELVLFHDTIAANVSLGEPGFTVEDVEHALRQAGAWEFVATLGDGVNHVVGERGAALSGGQRQRIALARALIHKPQLLILDEATSALDPLTAAGIIRNVSELAARDGITVLSISHQPAWMAVADRVVRVQEGRVTEVTPVAALPVSR